MAEVRCPMCGKSNPEELEVCKFCQARLKPLHINQPGDAPAEIKPPPKSAPSLKGEPDHDAGAFDWMQSLRQPEAFDEGQAEAAQEEPPDWLSGFRDQPDVSEEEQAKPPGQAIPEEAGEEDASWLKDIRSDFSSLDEAESLQPEKTPEEEQDWLRRLTGQEQEALPEQAEELPGWLSAMESTAEETGTAPAPEWLSQEGGPAGAGEEDLPAWLTGEAEGLPDWLSQPETARPPAAEPESAEEAGLPDWLSPGEKLQAGPVSPESEIPEDQALPAWLKEAATSEEPQLEPPAEAEETTLPDWFSQAGGESAAGEATGAEKDKKEETPDWMTEEMPELSNRLAAGEGELPISQAEPAQAETIEPADEVSEWLSGLESAETPAPAQFADEKGTAAGSFGQAEEDLDWLSELEGAEMPAQAQPTGEKGTAAEPSGQVEDDLDWLSELEAAFPDIPQESDASGMVGSRLPEKALLPDEEFEVGLDESLPGWLSEVAPEEKAESPGEEAASLMPADLPGWLEAMRPIEAVDVEAGGPVIEGEAEKVGPLAGLRGVLPAEPDISYINKPPTYSVKLQVTEEQKAFADLFEQLIQTEGDERPVPGRSVITTNNVLRIAVAVVLMLVVALPLLTGLQVNTPIIPVDEISQMVTSLEANAPVLLAVDYEPGLSGEMDAATAAVLDHLMIQGVFLTMVSTSPTGPVQAERLISIADRVGAHQYSYSGQVANLGFVPGGPVGLLNFADDLRGVFPRTLAQVDAWTDYPALQAVKSISDFSLVIVATEKPETARAWIEQVQPRLGGTPLMMIVSAQAEPIVRPYYEAHPKQVQGIVSGLAGGMAYESSIVRSGNAHVYWAAFSIGMLVAVILILIGGGANAMSAITGRGKGSTSGEAG
ncbi:MAG: hypothetical protein AB1894_24260 [Chloroflexota bacterium]